MAIYWPHSHSFCPIFQTPATRGAFAIKNSVVYLFIYFYTPSVEQHYWVGGRDQTAENVHCRRQ
jgi:hypothetical protein